MEALDAQAEWLGKQIRHFRTAQGMTQADLADEMRGRAGRPIKIHQSSISDWERGTSRVCLRYRRLLASALEIPMDVLYAPAPPGRGKPLADAA